MASLTNVFQVLNDMKSEKVIGDYAIGGAMAVLFYAEPTRTYDLDVFVRLPTSPGSIVLLTPAYEWLRSRGFKAEGEHVMIHGVPVQLIPAYNESTRVGDLRRLLSTAGQENASSGVRLEV